MDKIYCNKCGAENKANAKYCFQCGYELPKTAPVKEEYGLIETKQRSFMNKKIMGGVLGVVLAALSSFAVQQIFFRVPSYDKIMMKEASELNKSCPVMVDKITRLDNAVALPNKTFQYNYTLIGIDQSQLSVDTLKKYLEPQILNNVRTNPDMKKQRENKVTLVYYYKDEKGQFIHKYVVTPDMYK
jgi:hypothetical protein